ncbi:unnamed protein product [Prunus armeniaca]
MEQMSKRELFISKSGSMQKSDQLVLVKSKVGIKSGQQDSFRKHANPQSSRVRLMGPLTTTPCHVIRCQSTPHSSDQLLQWAIDAPGCATCHCDEGKELGLGDWVQSNCLHVRERGHFMIGVLSSQKTWRHRTVMVSRSWESAPDEAMERNIPRTCQTIDGCSGASRSLRS